MKIEKCKEALENELARLTKLRAGTIIALKTAAQLIDSTKRMKRDLQKI